MATRKKKLESNVDAGGWPKVTVGSHLMVTEYEDGRTTLVWDDEQLLKEVKEAIASVEGKEVIEEKPKRTTRTRKTKA